MVLLNHSYEENQYFIILQIINKAHTMIRNVNYMVFRKQYANCVSYGEIFLFVGFAKLLRVYVSIGNVTKGS